MQHTSLRTSSSPHARRGARLILVALLGLLGVLTGCGSRALHGAPANYPPLTPPPVQPTTPVALLGLQMIDAISDGGQHWQRTQLHARGYELGSIFFLTAQLGWLSIARIVGEKTDAVPALDIFRTQDGGLTWQPQEPPLPLLDALNSSPEAFFSTMASMRSCQRRW